MTVVVKADELEQLLDPGAEVERLATGFIFTEGPIWDAEGNRLLFCDVPGDVRRGWSKREGWRRCRAANNSNGMIYDPHGNGSSASTRPRAGGRGAGAAGARRSRPTGAARA